jgi:hypothetical protein
MYVGIRPFPVKLWTVRSSDHDTALTRTCTHEHNQRPRKLPEQPQLVQANLTSLAPTGVNMNSQCLFVISWALQLNYDRYTCVVCSLVIHNTVHVPPTHPRIFQYRTDPPADRMDSLMDLWTCGISLSPTAEGSWPHVGQSVNVQCGSMYMLADENCSD